MAESSNYDSILEAAVASAMLGLRNMSNEQLSNLLEDTAKIDSIIDNLPQARTLPTEREMGLAQNKSLAEWNLSQEPKLEEAKARLKETYDKAVSLKAEVEELKARLDKLTKQRSLDSSSAILQAAAQDAEDESEKIAESFIEGNIEIEQFLREYMEKKKVAHMRKIKSQKLLAFLKEQQYGIPVSEEEFIFDLFVPVMMNIVRPWRTFQNSLVRREFATLREKARKIEPKYLYEPKFEDTRVYPEYEALNVRLQGYDYVPLEKFQAYVHKIAKRFNFRVIESYAVAAQTQRVITYKPNSTVIDSELDVSIYDRVVRIGNVPTVRLPLFLNILQTHLPVGVKMTVKKHEKADEDYRYIPDLLLKAKQDELRSLDDVNVRRNLGWE
ncbi:hypothetical protein AB6A40_007243 [Gnathostoma spinigerum]|uniref:VPS37 C-terminal domain-containing protein n=1 Tax=Gnathostoma spinigerum TaxID=75299 RepID=A0ABD6EKP1_9BILA